MKTPAGKPPSAPPPLMSRPLAASEVPPQGLTRKLEASETECEAIATAFGLAGLRRLAATFQISGNDKRLHVQGRIEASLTQICVVTLEPFESDMTEDIDVNFVAPRADLMRELKPGQPIPEFYEPGEDEDEPEEMIDGRIDLGTLLTEFLALGLDPHPRKPGVAFEYTPEDDGPVSPFAKLAALKSSKDEG